MVMCRASRARLSGPTRLAKRARFTLHHCFVAIAARPDERAKGRDVSAQGPGVAKSDRRDAGWLGDVAQAGEATGQAISRSASQFSDIRTYIGEIPISGASIIVFVT